MYGMGLFTLFGMFFYLGAMIYVFMLIWKCTKSLKTIGDNTEQIVAILQQKLK